jgi:hypothetical protein
VTYKITTVDFVADPSLPKAVPMPENKFKTGDYGRHPSYPGWIWRLVGPHNNPQIGTWRLAFKLPGAEWPRPYGVPKIGDRGELGYSTLNKLNEMEVLALAASSE